MTRSQPQHHPLVSAKIGTTMDQIIGRSADYPIANSGSGWDAGPAWQRGN